MVKWRVIRLKECPLLGQLELKQLLYTLRVTSNIVIYLIKSHGFQVLGLKLCNYGKADNLKVLFYVVFVFMLAQEYLL